MYILNILSVEKNDNQRNERFKKVEETVKEDNYYSMKD